MKCIEEYSVPNIDLLKDNTFVTDEYEGYDLSFMAVSYLIDSRGKQEFLEILKDNNKIRDVGNSVLPKE